MLSCLAAVVFLQLGRITMHRVHFVQPLHHNSVEFQGTGGKKIMIQSESILYSKEALQLPAQKGACREEMQPLGSIH